MLQRLDRFGCLSPTQLYTSLNFYQKIYWFYVFILLQKLYVTMFPCNECAKIIIQVCLFVGSWC
jgi:hypothetical protein